MREPSTLARPYAAAVFRMAWEADALPEWSDSLQLLTAVVSDPAMQGLIADPRVPRASLADLVLSVVGDRFPEPARNLVRVLVDNQRLVLAPAIAQLFELERARAQRREKVLVRSAYPLDAEFEQTIATAMRARLGCEVDVESDVDRSLIGGVVIRTGDRVLDASVKGRLAQLAAALA
jgi:F-type H+-transporting ATPase subunit delta